jgi:hypothetical protein
MHFATRFTFFVLALWALPALADSVPVRVALPFGLHAGDITTSASKTPGQKFVTIDNVAVANPSRDEPQSYKPSDFHLLAGDKSYTPSVRPGLAAVDLSEASVLSPGQTLRVTVSFLVPDSVTSAKFEFTPHWMSDAGFTADWCCYYP